MSDGRCLFDQLQHFAQHRPERQALIGGGRRVSYLQLQQRGASPISVAVLERAIEVFCCEFEQGYGLTETVGPVAMLRPADHLGGGPILKSCGKAVASGFLAGPKAPKTL